MDWQTIGNIFLTSGIGILGWISRAIYGSIRDLQSELANHKVEVAKNYVTSASLQRIEDILTRKLDQVLERIDRKVDK